MLTRIGAIAITAGLALVQLACGSSSGATSDGPRDGSAKASDFEPFRTKDLDGNKVDLHEKLGRDVILVSFWATYCEPCKAEMPFLQRFWDEHRAAGLSIVSVALDSPDTVAEVAPYIRKQGYTFPVVIDESGDIAQSLNPSSTAPYAILVGRDGQVARRITGFQPSEAEELEDAITTLLAQSTP